MAYSAEDSEFAKAIITNERKHHNVFENIFEKVNKFNSIITNYFKFIFSMIVVMILKKRVDK